MTPLELANEFYDIDDPEEYDTLRSINNIFKPDGVMTELVMLRQPNKPLDKNNRIVAFYLILFFGTMICNCLLALHFS